MSRRKRNEASTTTVEPSDITVTPNVAVPESDIYPGDMVEDGVGEAATDIARSLGFAPPLAHFHSMLDGHFWYQNAARQLLDTLPADRPTAYVEVGVFKGQSLAWLGIEIANRGLQTTLHAVDNFAGWPGVLQGQALRAAFDTNIVPIREALGDRLVVHAMPSVDAAKTFADGALDVVWLDADHSYEAVKADIRAWLPKLRPGGTLGGDDWEMGGVAKAVTDAFGLGRITLGAGTRNGDPWTWWMVKV